MEYRRRPKPSRTHAEAALDRIEAMQARWDMLGRLPHGCGVDDLIAFKTATISGDVAALNRFRDRFDVMGANDG